MRLEHLLMTHFPLSRKEMKKAIREGRVTIGDQIANHVSNNVDPQILPVCLDGQAILDQTQVYYLLNKPAGYITATQDQDLPTVLDLIAPQDRVEGLYPIGRLDRDTQGLLLLTNNGPLGFRLLHPQYHLTKTYLVTVNGLLTQEDILAFAQGIRFIGGAQCQPALLTIHQASPQQSTASVTLDEGKYHQVKKMFLSVGVKVTSLMRTDFGPFHLDPQLAPGQYRPLSEAELANFIPYMGLNSKTPAPKI